MTWSSPAKAGVQPSSLPIFWTPAFAGEQMPSPLRNDVRRPEMLEEIGLAEADTRRAQDRVGGGGVEVEIGQSETGQIVAAAEAIAHAVGEDQLDLALAAGVQRLAVGTIDEGDRPVAA